MFKINKEYKLFLVFETKIGSSFLVAQFDVDVHKTFRCGHKFCFFGSSMLYLYKDNFYSFIFWESCYRILSAKLKRI